MVRILQFVSLRGLICLIPGMAMPVMITISAFVPVRMNYGLDGLAKLHFTKLLVYLLDCLQRISHAWCLSPPWLRKLEWILRKFGVVGSNLFFHFVILLRDRLVRRTEHIFSHYLSPADRIFIS